MPRYSTEEILEYSAAGYRTERYSAEWYSTVLRGTGLRVQYHAAWQKTVGHTGLCPVLRGAVLQAHDCRHMTAGI